MDDSDQPFVDGGDGGEKGPMSQVKGACCSFCTGIIMFPIMLWLTAWNEERTVCRDKALFEAEDHVHKLSCTSLEGNYRSGDLGFLSCDLDSDTFTQFKGSDFPGLRGMDDIFPTKAVSMSMTTEMLACHEQCVREVCSRRLRATELNITDDVGALVASGTETDEEELEEEELGEDGPLYDESNESAEADAIALSRRRKSCTRHCVEWDYSLEWDSAPTTSSFHDPRRAQDRCGASSNPSSASTKLTLGTVYVYAEGGSVKLLGGQWSLNRWQEESFPISKDVLPTGPVDSLWNFTADFAQPPLDLSRDNSVVNGEYLASCRIGFETLGCVRSSFKQGAPSHVTMLGKVSEQPGLFDEEGWLAPEDWICKGWDINRVCPMDMTSHMDYSKGFQSCDEDLTMDELFDTMHRENYGTAWAYRLFAWFGLWMSVSCCLNPIKVFVSLATEFADQITECIPGVGWVIDFLTDIVDTAVGCVLCIVSCFCASSCFCVVAGLAWLALRPLYGLTFLVFACCCFGCAGSLCYACRKSARKGNE